MAVKYHLRSSVDLSAGICAGFGAHLRRPSKVCKADRRLEFPDPGTIQASHLVASRFNTVEYLLS